MGEHEVPEGLDPTTVEALGKLSEALETTERARGRLFDFHQLTGEADFRLDDAVRLLRAAGHEAAARRVEQDVIGRDVVPGMWTFQLVEAYDDGYMKVFRDVERELRESLVAGRRHLYEAGLKRDRQAGKVY